MPTYIRVKDLANAATTPATDDFILLSGAANGARKISRADFLTAVAGFYTADPSTYKLATLDSGNKVLVSQLPSSAFSYKGTWAASTNTPTLANGTGTGGDTYYASDSGSVNFGAGSISFLAGDAVVYDGSVWQKVPDVVNLLDGKGTLDEAKTTLEIPDVGTSPQEVPLNGMLGSMAYQSADSVSVDTLEVTDKVDGNLGINTSPTATLEVTDATTNVAAVRVTRRNDLASTYSELGTTGGSGEVRSTDNLVLSADFDNNGSGSVIEFKVDGSQKAVIDSSGKVGIGVSPSETLSVSSSNTGRTGVSVGNTTTGGRTYIIGSVGSATDGGAAAGSFTIRDGNASANRVTIDSSGNMTLNSGNLVIGTSGKGIDFGSGGASSLLDDYERGTTAPTDASGAGLTLAGVGLNYVKIGSQVTAWVTVTYPTTSDTSTARIGNLPFAIGSSDIDRIGGFVASQSTGLSVSVLGTTGTGQVTFRKSDGSPYANSELSGKFIWFCFIYDVS